MTDVIMKIVDIFNELSHERKPADIANVYSSGAHGGKFSEEIYQEGHCKRNITKW